MIDIETLATRNDAALIQIGAATFDEEQSFLVSVDQEFYLGDGAPGAKNYFVDPRTVKWWETQGEAAKTSLATNVVDNPGYALEALNKWLKATGFQSSYKRGARGVWANGVQFDMSILRYAYSIETGHNNNTPWHYRQERDMRTIVQVFGKTLEGQPKCEGLTKHRADHDCIRQIRLTKAILSNIERWHKGNKK